jgi:hemerythrin-like metal-binding protein
MAKQLMALIPASGESAAVVASPNRVASWRTVADLPPELVTGHQVIDLGHCHLLSTMATLRQICIDHPALSDCGNCTSQTRDRCDGNLVGMLGDLLAFILDHFKAEEEIMRDSLLLMVDRDLCEAHMEDHAAISGKVQEIVAALDVMNTVSRIRELEDLLSRWVTNHIAMHDVLLARWIEREDSVLRQQNRLAAG